MLGAYLSYRALSPADCEAARSALLKAEELGNDLAAWKLAQLASNDTCGELNYAERERWLTKAAVLDNPFAVLALMNQYANSDEPEAKVQRYVYARVAAGYWDKVQPSTARPRFDAAALQEMEQGLSAADRSRAEAEAATILQQMLKRHERFVAAKPVEFARGSAGARAEWTGWQSDYRNECQWNLKNNCRGTQRLTYVELTSRNQEFLSCRIELRERDFVNGKPVATPLSRQVLIGPQATRKLLLGDVNGEPDKKSLSATCTPVPKLADNAAAGKCRAKLQGSVDVERFYPESAKRNGIEGSAVVRYWVPPGSDELTDAEIASSSGNGDLDLAAINTLRSSRFTHECDYGLGSVRISFKLSE
jgi:TonB family protein